MEYVKGMSITRYCDEKKLSIELRLVLATEKYAGIRVWDLDQYVLAGIIFLVCPIRKNNLGGPVDIRALLDPPVDQQLEVTEALGSPQVLITMSFVRITVDNSIDNLPIPIRWLLHHPTIQISSIEKRSKSLGHDLARSGRCSWFGDRHLDCLVA